MTPEQYFCNGSFAGIGARLAHPKITKVQAKFGFVMCLKGVINKSGRAYGSDYAFEVGTKLGWKFLSSIYEWPDIPTSACQHIMLPWNGFNGAQHKPDAGYFCNLTEECFEMARLFHQGWDSISPGDKKLMARNVQEILGQDLRDPVRFLIAYTDGGQVVGGTGLALKIAKHYGINIHNLGEEGVFERVTLWLDQQLSELSKRFNADLKAYINDAVDNYVGLGSFVYGDIIEECEAGNYDVLIQMLSCQNVQGEGLAKDIAILHPQVAQVNNETLKGDRNKLGKYTSCSVIGKSGRSYEVVNIYGQYFWGRDEKVYADYDAIRKSLQLVSSNFKGKRIAIPKIGSGYAQGCWMTISSIIESYLVGNEVTLVLKPSKEHDKKNKLSAIHDVDGAEQHPQQKFRF